MTDILDHTYAVIMAGGGGTRLWPLSRRANPKQMLPLLEEHRTLFQTTVQRLEGLFPPDHILVVTVDGQADELESQAPNIPSDNFLVEPAPRGTAPAIGLAAAVLQKRDPQAVMVSLHADHFIRNQDMFRLLVRVAVDVASAGYLVTLGITPTYPATIYGYIQRSNPLPEKFGYPVYKVLRFKEKPDEKQAREMISGSDHYWNSGMFFWKVDSILAEFKRLMPNLDSALMQISEVWQTPEQNETLNRLWTALESETIDYGIMEQADNVVVLPAGGLEWSDVGSWDSLFDVLLPDKNGNILFAGEHIAEDTHHSLVYGNHGERLIVTIGVDDLIVVDTGDVLLVCHKDHAQKVRKVVDDLRKSKREKYT